MAGHAAVRHVRRNSVFRCGRTGRVWGVRCGCCVCLRGLRSRIDRRTRSVQGAKAPDATGEPQEGDELQVIARPRPQSDPSIKSYGLDPSVVARPSGPGEATTRFLMRARRAKLSRIVVAAVAACSAILVAAGVAHMARANN